MKYFISLCIVVLLPYMVMAGGESGDQSSFVFTTPDSLINGFMLVPTEIYPFSPVVTLEFNLPESSYVSLYVTDTLGLDTIWYCHEEPLGPGFYKTLPGAIRKMGEGKLYRMIDAHLSVKCNYGASSGLTIESSFEAKRRMAFR